MRIPIHIQNNLNNIRWYWVCKKWLRDVIIFRFWRGAYRSSFRMNESVTTARLLWPTLYVFGKSVIYALIIISILESYSYFLPPIPPLDIEFDKNAVDSFLTAVASISGVFLGLYFTAISSIAGTFLTRATPDVRQFFLTSPLGQQYVQTVAMTGIVSVFYLATKSFGHEIHPSGIFFLGLLAAYIVIRFWTVGSSVFNTLEPTASMPWIGKGIADSVRSIVPPGLQWGRDAIQNHHQKLTTYNLELARNLIDFGIVEIKLSNRQLVQAVRHLAGFLMFYADYKKRIPTNSFWYKTKAQYESWTLTSSINIHLALNTGTTVQPKIVKNFSWFEEEVLDIVKSVFDVIAARDSLESAFEAHEFFVEVAEIYAADFDTEGLKTLFQKVERVSLQVGAHDIDASESVKQKEQIAFIDSEGRLATAALLGLVRYLDKVSPSNISESINKIDWHSANEIYLAGLPFSVLPILESVASDIRNEVLIEGERVSPEWYIRTLVIQKYLYALQRYFEYIKSLHDEYFKKRIDKFIEAQRLYLAVQFIQKWIEFANKYERLVFDLKKHVEACNEFQQVKDLPWPKFDFEAEEKLAEERTKEVENKLVHLLPKLKNIETHGELPDYFGQALTIGVQACYDACRENDAVRFKQIFPAVFLASLEAHEKTGKKVADWAQEESKIIYQTEPLVNLMEISGFAKLYAELFQNQELWNVAKTVWDTYLSRRDAQNVIKFLVAIVEYRATIFKIMPQAELRSGWEIMFGRKLEEMELPGFAFSDVRRNRSTPPTHPSPLIRAVVRWGGLTAYSPDEVFFTTYLSEHSGAEGVEFPNKRDLRSAIERESERNSDEIQDENSF